MAWLMQLPFIRISITGSSEIDDLAGKTGYTEGVGTHFVYGRLPRAWQRPAVVCMDEPNTGRPEVWQFIRPLTDNSKVLTLDMNQGETIERHADCYLGMAMNPAWDVRNVGTEEIGDADGSRLSWIDMQMPPAQLVREIIRTRCAKDEWEIDDARLDILGKISEDIAALCDNGTLPITWGVRDQIKVARASRWFPMLTAYRMARADALEPEVREVLLDAVRAVVPSN